MDVEGSILDPLLGIIVWPLPGGSEEENYAKPQTE
jgi:hypothetical protein